MDELMKLYNALIADPVIKQHSEGRIKFYEYPATGDVDGVVIIIDPLSEPLESEYGDDLPIVEAFPVQVDVWSRDSHSTELVMKRVNKIFRSIGYLYNGPGPNEYDEGIFRSVRRYTGKYYTSDFEDAR